MELTIDLPADVEQRRRTEADRRGMDADEYARSPIQDNLPDAEDAAALDLFAASDIEDATDEPSEISGRPAEWEELRRHLVQGGISVNRMARDSHRCARFDAARSHDYG